MKPVSIIAAIVFLLSACTKESQVRPVQRTRVAPTVMTDIKFEVFSALNYADTIYSNSTAEVYLCVARKSLGYAQYTLVWDTTISRRQLAMFPLSSSKITIQKSVPMVPGGEMVYASYTINYIRNGLPSQLSGGEVMMDEKTTALASAAL